MKPSPSEASLDPPPLRLLVVAQDRHDAERVRRLLQSCAETPVEVSHASRVDDALPMVQDGGYQAILLDLGLEGDNGLKALSRLRVAAAAIPIIAITSRENQAHALKAVRAGAEDYLSKDESDPHLILRSVLQAVERCRTLSDLTRAREREHYVATHDAVTDLPNRNAFLNQLSWSIAYAARNRSQVALLFLDLDRFKTINDTLSHRVGDELLKIVAGRLRGLVRRSDLVARIGGDEFIVMLQNVERDHDPARVAEKVLHAVSRPFVLAGRDHRITTSIGIALFPGDGSDPDMLVRAADMAMYHAKAGGRNRHSYYAEEMNSVVANVLDVENGLRGATGHESLVLHYQPQVHVGFGIPVGAEALLRWRRPSHGLVSPDGFIGIAEETDLINRIGSWALRTACEEAAEWPRWRGTRLKVSVNVSPRQLADTDFVDFVARTLRETGLARGQLELEITERSVLQEDEKTVATLRHLGRLGVGVLIDDLGTGYSSLSALRSLPLVGVKVDRSFVAEVASNAAVATITEGLIGIVKGLGLDIVAEGVETREQMEFLHARGCHVMQGYLFGKPQEAAEFAARVEEGDWPSEGGPGESPSR